MTNDDMITALLFMDDVNLDNGPLEVIPGSHKAAGVPPKDVLELDRLSVPVLGRAGSVFVFHNGLWHGGIENKTDSPRITAHIIYAPVWLRPIGSHRYPDEFKRALTPRRRLLLADNDNPRLKFPHTVDYDRCTVRRRNAMETQCF